MNRDQVLSQLDEMLELKTGTLQGTEELADVPQWDSLAMMNFIAFASDHRGLTLSPRQISACRTVDELIGLLGKP